MMIARRALETRAKTRLTLGSALLLASTMSGPAWAQDKGSLNPRPLPALAHPDDPKTPAKQLFGRKTTAAAMKPQTIGFYSKGCLAGAAALLFPIDWPEPFGLVMIEAMACGTHVIAYRSGSVPEVIDHGVTGFVVDSEEEAIDAVNQLHRLDRSKVRARFEERFSAHRMAREYEARYRKLAAARP